MGNCVTKYVKELLERAGWKGNVKVGISTSIFTTTFSDRHALGLLKRHEVYLETALELCILASRRAGCPITDVTVNYDYHGTHVRILLTYFGNILCVVHVEKNVEILIYRPAGSIPGMYILRFADKLVDCLRGVLEHRTVMVFFTTFSQGVKLVFCEIPRAVLTPVGIQFKSGVDGQGL